MISIFFLSNYKLRKMDANKTTQSKLPQRKIGNDSVPALGLGLMGMSAFYTHGDSPEVAEKKHLELLTKAADAGMTFWDTSDIYGPFTNEELIGKWFTLTGRRKEIFLATKFGISYDPKTGQRVIRGDKEYVKECIEGSLKRLQTDYVDLYYQHRVDKNVRIEETVEAMAELVKAGKVRYLGLSECSANTLRRANKVHPIAAVKLEYSLIYLDIELQEVGLKQACDEIGAAIVAFSPLRRGFFTGQINSRSDLLPGDSRLDFSEENPRKSLELLELVTEIAERKGCTPGQLALAWLLKQGDNVIPLFGSRDLKHFEENLGALKVELSEEEVKQIRELAVNSETLGERYPPDDCQFVSRHYLTTQNLY